MSLRLLSGLGLAAVQASAMVLPTSGQNQGLGTSLGDIKNGTHQIELAREVLSPASVIDCSKAPTSPSDAAGAAAASRSFLKFAAAANTTLGPHQCAHREAEGIRAQLCNRGRKLAPVPLEEAVVAFDTVRDHCQATGGIVSVDGWVFSLVHTEETRHERRLAPPLQRRDCVSRDSATITACETDICDPKNREDDDGNCEVPTSGFPENGRECPSYCEKKAFKYYGEAERDFDMDYCNGNDCTLSEGTTVTYSTSFSINLGLNAGVNNDIASAGISAGVGWSWGKSVGETRLQGASFGDGKCGYWHKIPVMVHSCGLMSIWRGNSEESQSGSGLSCQAASSFYLKDESFDACSVSVATVPGSDRADILVVPRWTNCDDREYLDFEEQSPEWKRIFGGDLANSEGQGAYCGGNDEPDEFGGGKIDP